MIYDFFVNTTPSRLKESKCLRAAVHSLLHQTITPRKVYVCIPHYYKRLNKEVANEDIPKWLYNDSPKVEVIRGYDYGPATRYVYASTVSDAKGDSSNICSADDDVIYHYNAFENLSNFKKAENLDAASCWSYIWWNSKDDAEDIDYNLRYLQGVDMVLTNSSNLRGFRDFLSDCFEGFPDCVLNDDLTVSYWLQYNNKKIGSLNVGNSEPVYSIQPTASDDSRITDQLGKGERFHKTFEIISHLKKNYPIKKLNIRE